MDCLANIEKDWLCLSSGSWPGRSLMVGSSTQALDMWLEKAEASPSSFPRSLVFMQDPSLKPHGTIPEVQRLARKAPQTTGSIGFITAYVAACSSARPGTAFADCGSKSHCSPNRANSLGKQASKQVSKQASKQAGKRPKLPYCQEGSPTVRSHHGVVATPDGHNALSLLPARI